MYEERPQDTCEMCIGLILVFMGERSLKPPLACLSLQLHNIAVLAPKSGGVRFFFRSTTWQTETPQGHRFSFSLEH